MLGLDPICLETDRCGVLFVGDVTWPLKQSPVVELSPHSAECEFIPNLEGALLDRDDAPLAEGRTLGLWNDLTALRLLGDRRVRVANGANNHLQDFRGGLVSTWETCRTAGITIAGVGASATEAARPVRLKLRDGTFMLLYFAGDRRIGCLPCATGWGVNTVRVDSDAARLRLLRATFPNDVMVVVLHWGWELQQWPEPGQRTYARGLAAAGVDLIVSHHAHVCQAWESVGEATVFYGIGNFLLHEGRYVGIDLRYPPEARRSAGVMLDSAGVRVVEFVADPVGGVVRQASGPVSPGGSFLRRVPECGSDLDYAAFYRERNSVSWWYPTWAADESRAGRLASMQALRAVAAAKRVAGKFVGGARRVSQA